MSELDITISDLNDISEILDNNGYGGWCKTLDKAVELLKEKQQRVLTLEEVKQAEVVWNEWTSVDGFVECMMFDRVDADGDYRFTEKLGSQIYFEPSEYNESWRCWSARPTAEQMQETGWDGEQ